MCESNQVLRVSWGSMEINNAEFSGTMYWTMSSSNGPLDFADMDLGDQAAPGHIHIHKDDVAAATQAHSAFILIERPSPDSLSWKWNDISSRYTPSSIIQKPFILHPLNLNLALTLDERFKPRFVLLTSLKQRLAREKPPVYGARKSQRKR